MLGVMKRPAAKHAVKRPPVNRPLVAAQGTRVRKSSSALRGQASLEPVRNVHEYLATKLGREIVGGYYKPGDQLPNEIDLRDHLSVSRTALREAYRVLSAKGLIASRQNVGTRVRPRSDWNMLDPAVLKWHLETGPSEEFIVNLFDLRQMLEPPAAARAARGGSSGAIAAIEVAFADMASSSDGSGDLIGADVRFHEAILTASANPLVASLGGLIHAALVGSFKLGWPSAATMSDMRLNQHRVILDAIRDRRPDEARNRMAALLEVSIEDVRRALRVGSPVASRRPKSR